MDSGSVRNMAGTSILCLLVLFAMSSVSGAEVFTSLPIGQLVTSGSVSIGGILAPTGSVVFSGETIATNNGPAVITFRAGSNVVMTPGSTATFSRSGDSLVIRADRGALGFSFAPGEDATLQAGNYRFVAFRRDLTHAGELALGADGQVFLSLSSGSLSALDVASGKSFEVLPERSTGQQTKKGTVTKGKMSFSDPMQNWEPNSLKGQILEVAGEKHKIVSNTPMTITIEDTWSINSGAYEYSLTGAAPSAFPKWAGAAPSALPKWVKIAIPATAAAGAATGAAVSAGRGSKSPG